MEEKRQVFHIDNFPWDTNGYCPRTEVSLTTLSHGLQLHFVSWESPVRAVETQHHTPVWCDSCMEFFIQPDPVDSRYMNVECNPNGAVYCNIKTPGGESVVLPVSVIETFGVETHVYADRWELTYQLPAQALQEIFPGYVHKEGTRIRGNFYKCGDKTEHPHYGCWHPITWPKPNFHLPEFFGDIII